MLFWVNTAVTILASFSVPFTVSINCSFKTFVSFEYRYCMILTLLFLLLFIFFDIIFHMNNKLLHCKKLYNLKSDLNIQVDC